MSPYMLTLRLERVEGIKISSLWVPVSKKPESPGPHGQLGGYAVLGSVYFGEIGYHTYGSGEGAILQFC